MISLKKAQVIEVINRHVGVTEVKIKIGNEEGIAINYDFLVGDVEEGDSVILNTTAVELELGTGGKHIVFWNLRHNSISSLGKGHIIKMRYTPMQINCFSVEEQDSPYHQAISQVSNLDGMPVIIGTLHSQLPAVVSTIKEIRPQTRITYVMTDGGALPLAFSNHVRLLKDLKLIDTTVTCGHAFGGDLEAVNIYTALIASKAVCHADVAVVIMGPGIVGTETTFGHTAVEQGEIINAANILKGKPIAIPRISFQDKRARHYGVSHHTLTALSSVALTSSVVPIPEMEKEKLKTIMAQLEKHEIVAKHKVEVVKNEHTLPALAKWNLKPTTMGRTVEEESEFFQAAGAAGIYAVKLLGKR